MNQRTPLIFSASIVVALLLGYFLVPTTSMTFPLILVFFFIATFLTVGGLERGWQTQSRNYVAALRLLAINIIAGSLPMAVVGLWLGADTPAGLGFLLLAIVPVAGGIPAYAAALGIRAERITLFALMSYVIAIFLTPLLLGVLSGESASTSTLWISVGVGFIAPSVLGVVLSRTITVVAPAVRRRVILVSLLIVMLGIGQSLSDVQFNVESLGAPLLVVVFIGLARAPLGALIAIGLHQVPVTRTSTREAMLAGGYRNCALAAVIAISMGVPEAAIPGALGLMSEAIVMALLAIRFSDSPLTDAKRTRSRHV
jgi:predicted Na+-dependent transporter